MGQPAHAPSGYRGTRAEILKTLKMAQPLTAKELADRFGVTANALRRHLKELESEGMVRYRREIRGVGGPVFAFSLTESGEALFPRAYDRALAEVLDQVRQQQGDEGLVRLFERRWDEIAQAARPELELLPVGERAARLAELLTSLGYMAEARPAGKLFLDLPQHLLLRDVGDRAAQLLLHLALEAIFQRLGLLFDLHFPGRFEISLEDVGHSLSYRDRRARIISTIAKSSSESMS